VIAVSNSSPLISLARAGRLDLLKQLFGVIHLADEVWHEVVVRGAGRPAAETVRAADWIEVHPALQAVEMSRLHAQHPLGAGELATVELAQAMKADLAIIDERAARDLAQARGVAVMGCVGLLEAGFRRGLVPDLRQGYLELLAQGTYINRSILNRSLAAFGLPRL
jgi:predicted nucleic acid-binding protein